MSGINSVGSTVKNIVYNGQKLALPAGAEVKTVSREIMGKTQKADWVELSTHFFNNPEASKMSLPMATYLKIHDAVGGQLNKLTESAQNIMKFEHFDSNGVKLTGNKLASMDELVANLGKVAEFFKLDTPAIKNLLTKK
jgi:hypothetical protein